MLKRISVICLLIMLYMISAYAATKPSEYTETYRDDGTLCKSVMKAVVVPNRMYTIIGIDTYKKKGENKIVGGAIDFVQINRRTINIKNIHLLSDYQDIPISLQGYSREVGLEYTTNTFIFVGDDVEYLKAFFERPSTKYIIRIYDNKNNYYDIFLDEEHIINILKVLTP